MKYLRHITSSLTARVNAMVQQAEVTHPGMREVAAMVYVGDVYALREQREPAKNDGWDGKCYSGDTPDHL